MATARIPGQPFFPPLTPSPFSGPGVPRPLAARLHDGAVTGDEAALRDAVDEATRIAGSGLTPDVESELEQIAEHTGVSPSLRASAMIAIASSREHDDDIPAATTWVSRAAESDPTASTYARLVTLAALSGDYSSADELLQDALARWGSDTDLVTAAASMALDRGDIEASRHWAALAWEQAPDHPVSLALTVRFALIDGHPETAEAPARRLIMQRPSAGRPLLAIVLDALDRLAEDRGVLEAVLADLPNDLWAEMSIAEVLVRQGRDSDAREVYDHVLARTPNVGMALRSRGLLAARQNDFDAAERDFDRLAVLSPGDGAWVTAIRGELARVRGDAVGAAALFSSLDLHTCEDWVLLSLASVQYELNRFDEARTAYEILLARNPDDLQALLGLVDVELASPSDPEGAPTGERAERSLRRVLQLNPGDPTSHALYGELLRRRGEYPDALTQFDAALAIEPDWAYAIASKGQVLIAIDKVEEGLALLEDAVARSAMTAWMVDELAKELIRYDAGHAEQRLRRVQRQIRGRGDDVSLVLSCRIDLATQENRYDDAERLYREARATAPDDSQLMIGHAQVLRALGRLDDALATLRPGSLTDGEDDVGWERINILWELDRLDEVRLELERLIARADSAPSAATLGALGEIRRMEGRRVEARALLERALDADPDYEYALSSLGALERQTGDTEAARQHLERAVNLGSEFALMELVLLNSATGDRKGLRRLADGIGGHIPDVSRTKVRASALRELGEYSRALKVLDDHLTELGTTPELVLMKAWAEADLGKRRRAAASFLSLVDAAPMPLLPQLVDGLIHVDRWEEARAMLANRPDLAPAGATVAYATAILWSAAGAWAAAAEAAGRARHSTTSGNIDVCALEAGCLRLLDRAEEAVEIIRSAHDVDPTNLYVHAELAESLLAAGRTSEAVVHFAEVLVALQRRVHRSTDQMNLEGWCLLRTRQASNAASVFLKTLSATNHVAAVLFNLIVATLSADEVSQATVLSNRAKEELCQLSVPTRRGVVATTLFDLASIRGSLSPAAAVEAGHLNSWLSERWDELGGALTDAPFDLANPPWPTQADISQP